MSKNSSPSKTSELDEQDMVTVRTAVDLEKIAEGVRLILEGIGEDPARPGLQRTPERVAEMYAELTAGMREDPQEHVAPVPGDTLYQGLKPLGVMVVIEAEHTCMTLRGVKKPGAITVTSAVLGGFRKDQ